MKEEVTLPNYKHDSPLEVFTLWSISVPISNTDALLIYLYIYFPCVTFEQ